ncbi:unnamed protein product [Brassica napus]|uniref:(rape) hypothetical protein n=1 Tax=Brassica napus TaxID=3708 RepID=A0A816R9G8_BRANA|nr:unnamed protein product [Brassica napus]
MAECLWTASTVHLVSSNLLSLSGQKPQPITKPRPIGKGPTAPPGRTLGNIDEDEESQFPDWFRPEDRRILETNGVSYDVSVAQDGTGNFTTIMDAVREAPDYSWTRFVIYIKKVYT